MLTNKIYVDGETPFQILSRSFAIGEAPHSYTLQSSVDCKDETDTNAHFLNYTDTTIEANKQHDVIFVPAGRWWKLVGNTGKVVIRY